MSNAEALPQSLGSMPSVDANKRRLAALDQFRGYTMAGMFLVNFVGEYAAVHPVFGHHHTYCSYADTIMPGFFFAVGFAFRLTYMQRVRECGTVSAVRHALWRNFKLILVGVIAYNIDSVGNLLEAVSKGYAGPFLYQLLTVDSFQALVHIAFACLWILPVIGLPAGVRWGFLFFSAALHSFNLHFFYYAYAHDHVTDGGALGFIGWAVPTLLGTLVCDAVRENRAPAAQWKRMWWWAAAFMLGGYALACLNLWNAPPEGAHGIARCLVEPPFVPPTRPVDMWTMDQQVASTSYMVFSAGFSVAVYLIFVLLSDAWGFQVGVFRTFGKNPLFGYLFSGVVATLIEFFLRPFSFTNESPLYAVLFVFSIVFFIDWATLRYMEYRNWYWRL